MTRSVWSASSLLALSISVAVPKAGASSTHSKRFAREDVCTAPEYVTGPTVHSTWGFAPLLRLGHVGAPLGPLTAWGQGGGPVLTAYSSIGLRLGFAWASHGLAGFSRVPSLPGPAAPAADRAPQP